MRISKYWPRAMVTCVVYESLRKAVGILVCLSLWSFTTLASSAVLASYDASLGTLPQAQGFGYYTDPGYPPPTVGGGLLREFRQTGEQTAQFWYARGLPIAQNSSTYTLEAEIRIISSNYIPNIGTGPRFGYYLELLTDDGHGYVVGISSSGVALDTDVSFSPNNDFTVSPFNTSDGFHKYRLVVNVDGASLYIDGNLIVTTPPGNSGFGPGRQAGVTFGDASGYGISQSELKNIKVSVLKTVLLDPVALDENASLLDGRDVTTDTARLSLLGRIVDGVASDGVAQIVIRIADVSPGDRLRLSLPGLFPSNLEGTLRAVGSTDQVSSIVVAATSGAAPMAFAIYQAPLDFVDLAADRTLDRALPTRSISVKVERLNAPTSTTFVPITISRPPLVFVHGFAGDPADWDRFVPLVHDRNRFTIFKVNYGRRLYKQVGQVFEPTTAINIVSTEPAISTGSVVAEIRQSHLGFSVNARPAGQELIDFIDRYRQGFNPLSLPLAASQADVVAHSMGGLVIRYWSLLPEYRSPRNFNRGYVHKLITLGTPHLGSPQAILSILPETSCAREYAAVAGRLSFSTVSAGLRSTLSRFTLSGAAGELAGDGVGVYLSDQLKILKASGLTMPTATIAGDVTPIERDIDSAFLSRALRALCSDPLSDKYTTAAFDTIFDAAIRPGNVLGSGQGRKNDGAVPLTSALLDPAIRSCPSGTCFLGVAHGRKTALFFGSSKQYLTDDSTIVANRVLDLLNSSILETGLWK